jgi:hypothetical protein
MLQGIFVLIDIDFAMGLKFKQGMNVRNRAVI